MIVKKIKITCVSDDRDVTISDVNDINASLEDICMAIDKNCQFDLEMQFDQFSVQFDIYDFDYYLSSLRDFCAILFTEDANATEIEFFDQGTEMYLEAFNDGRNVKFNGKKVSRDTIFVGTYECDLSTIQQNTQTTFYYFIESVESFFSNTQKIIAFQDWKNEINTMIENFKRLA